MEGAGLLGGNQRGRRAGGECVLRRPDGLLEERNRPVLVRQGAGAEKGKAP
jgi:hypothetical protein